MNDHQSVLFQLREAARHCADPAWRDIAKNAADRIQDALVLVADRPSLYRLRILTSEVGHGFRVYSLMPDLPEPSPEVGGRIDVLKAA